MIIDQENDYRKTANAINNYTNSTENIQQIHMLKLEITKMLKL